VSNRETARVGVAPLGDCRLTATDKIVYVALCLFADEDGRCAITQGKIAQVIGCSRAGVNRSIGLLCDCGYVGKQKISDWELLYTLE
jgi:predicted transcriptional regulator